MNPATTRQDAGGAEVLPARSEEDVVAALGDLAARALRAIPCGLGSRIGPLPAGGVRVSTSAMDRITRFRPDDLTLSAGPGCRLADLLAEVGKHGLWLPVDPPGRERSLAGVFAEGLAGPLAYGFPHPRDLLLGLAGVLSDGTRFKTGARVVKSVAGFDLPKLFVGSRGSLFVATELHVRLRPAPRARCLLASGPLPRAEAASVFVALRKPPLALASLTLLSEGKACRVVAESFGEAAAVAWHASLCAPLARPADDEEPALRETRARLSSPDAGGPSPRSTSGTLLPSRVPSFVESLPADAAFAIQGHGGFVVHGHDVLAAAEALGGHGTTGAGRTTSRAPAVMRLERELKRALDPGLVLWEGAA